MAPVHSPQSSPRASDTTEEYRLQSQELFVDPEPADLLLDSENESYGDSR